METYLDLNIKAQTTGFSSPAETYVDKRLDLNELVVKNIYTTFYLRYSGPKVFGLDDGDVLVIDKSMDPKEGDMVVVVHDKLFKVREYNYQDNVWGKVTWVLKNML